MLRFSFIFITALLVEFIIGEGNISKFSFYYALIFSCIVTSFSYLSEILKILSGTPSKGETGRGQKYDLVSFNDAIADELMRIRSDLVSVKLKQDRFAYWDVINFKMIQEKLSCQNISADFLGKLPYDLLNNTPDDFSHIFRMCAEYPSSFLCEEYKAPSGTTGKIILVLDNDFLDEDGKLKFDAEELRKINSSKQHKFTSGMNMSVYRFEPEVGKPHLMWISETKNAKILSIEENGWEYLVITLEIDLDGLSKSRYWCPNEDVGKDKIIRKIEIFNDYPCHFIPDKKNSKTNLPSFLTKLFR